jgi:hypothetical protein
MEFDMCFRMVYELSLLKKLFFFAFFGLDPILCEKLTKIFSHLNVIIHTPFESPCQI